MPDDAGIDIDFDQELASIQGTAAGLPAPEPAQLVVAGKVITSSRTVEFLGARFRIADRIGLMPLLKFSAFANLDVQDPRALGAMYAMLRDCIHPGQPGCGECEHCAPGRCGDCRACERAAITEDDDLKPSCQVNPADETRCAQYDRGDWQAFEDHAIDTKADADDLMDVLSKTIELISARPTEPPPTSSAGRRATRDGSMARSSARRARGSRH
jgi:hypothetical protein